MLSPGGSDSATGAAVVAFNVRGQPVTLRRGQRRVDFSRSSGCGYRLGAGIAEQCGTDSQTQQISGKDTAAVRKVMNLFIHSRSSVSFSRFTAIARYRYCTLHFAIMFHCILQLHYANIAIFTDIAFLLVEITQLS
jgi:hypothetical protein